MKKKSKYIFLLFTLAGIVLIFMATLPGPQATIPAYFVANQAYQSGKFQDAIRGFYDALKENPGLIQKDPLVRFKIGYSFYQTGDYKKCMDVMEAGRKSLNEIEDYLLYFQILAHFRMGDTLVAYQKIHALRHQFDRSPLLSLVDSIQAGIYLKYQLPDSAQKYLKRMLNAGGFEQTEILLNLIHSYRDHDQKSEFQQEAHNFLRKYPFHNEAEQVFEDLLKSYPEKIKQPDFDNFINYLFTTSQFLTAQKLIDDQSNYAETPEEKENFEWLPIEIQYRQGEYEKVLKWCLANRKKYRSLSMLREIDLYVARTYLRVDQTEQSIKAYLDFQKRYPKDSLSPEVLWKVAWLYEERFDIQKAIETYKKLVKTYRRSSFTDEAFFRIGLDLYRIRKYAQARNEWQKALRKVNDSGQRDRLKYWIGKSYESERHYKEQGEIYIDLAKRPIDSFYNLKAFYLTSNGQDVHRTIQEAMWELHQSNQSYLPDFISKFKRAIEIEELLGPEWGSRELLLISKDPEEWTELFALGELQERMNNFGNAYRRFRSVFNQKFSSANLPEMVPVFKKLYPFYFSHSVESFSDTFAVPKALIWSVIKKESAFEPRIISYANAYGLMQLLPGTASQIAPNLGVRYTSTNQLFNPDFNIMMGTYYLSSLLKRYQGNYIMALAAYNAGPHRVDRWKRRYPTNDDDLFMENLEFEQTRVYVRTCMKYFWLYRAIMNPGDMPEEIVNYPVKISNLL